MNAHPTKARQYYQIPVLTPERGLLEGSCDFIKTMGRISISQVIWAAIWHGSYSEFGCHGKGCFSTSRWILNIPQTPISNALKVISQSMSQRLYSSKIMKYSHKTDLKSWVMDWPPNSSGLNPREHYLLEPPKEEASALVESYPTTFMGKREFP